MPVDYAYVEELKKKRKLLFERFRWARYRSQERYDLRSQLKELDKQIARKEREVLENAYDNKPKLKKCDKKTNDTTPKDL